MYPLLSVSYSRQICNDRRTLIRQLGVSVKWFLSKPGRTFIGQNPVLCSWGTLLMKYWRIVHQETFRCGQFRTAEHGQNTATDAPGSNHISTSAVSSALPPMSQMGFYCEMGLYKTGRWIWKSWLAHNSNITVRIKSQYKLCWHLMGAPRSNWMIYWDKRIMIIFLVYVFSDSNGKPPTRRTTYFLSFWLYLTVRMRISNLISTDGVGCPLFIDLQLETIKCSILRPGSNNYNLKEIYDICWQNRRANKINSAAAKVLW